MRQTSLDAFEHIKESLNRREEEVLEALTKLGEATNNEVAEKLGWSINRVTGRMNSLNKKKIVEELEKRPCKITGYNAIVWRKK